MKILPLLYLPVLLNVVGGVVADSSKYFSGLLMKGVPSGKVCPKAI